MKPSRLLLALIGGLLALAIVLGSLPLLGIKLPQTLQPLWWGLLLALSGFQYHGPKGRLEFKPCVTPENFRCAFNTAEGWGQFSQVDAAGGRQWKVTLKWGKLRLSELRLDSGAKNIKKSVALAGKDLPAEWTEKDGTVTLKFAEPVVIQAGEELVIS